MKQIQIDGKLYTLIKIAVEKRGCDGCAFNVDDSANCHKSGDACLVDGDHVWELAEGDKQ
jgi:hypothetical protein